MGVKRSRSASCSASESPSRSPSFSREASADVKIVHLDAPAALSTHHTAVMKCSLPPHQPLSFASFEEYDVHYQKSHMNRCSECHKNFPDEHFLHLHIAENHDPISAAKRDRGEKTYACLIPSCDRLCSTPQKRRLHCIDKHTFPRNYDFFVINDGIDRRSSMLRPQHRRRSSAMSSTTNNGHRRRSSTLNSPTSGGHSGDSRAEEMDVVKDDQGTGDSDNDSKEPDDTPKSPQRAPIRLRGRGGFIHSGGRGRGRGTAMGSSQTSPTPAQPSKKTPHAQSDLMENLTSSMSALQFVPHAVRTANARGKGNLV